MTKAQESALEVDVRELRGDVAAVRADVGEVKDAVGALERHLFVGNGRPSVLARVETLEALAVRARRGSELRLDGEGLSRATKALQWLVWVAIGLGLVWAGKAGALDAVIKLVGGA